MCQELHIDGAPMSGQGHLAKLVGRRALLKHMGDGQWRLPWNACFCPVDLEGLGAELGYDVARDPFGVHWTTRRDGTPDCGAGP